jgi:hypothetical protein
MSKSSNTLRDFLLENNFMKSLDERVIKLGANKYWKKSGKYFMQPINGGNVKEIGEKDYEAVKDKKRELASQIAHDQPKPVRVLPSDVDKGTAKRAKQVSDTLNHTRKTFGNSAMNDEYADLVDRGILK